MIPIRNKRTDISKEVAKGKKLQEKIKVLADEVAKKSIDGHVDLDKVIAEVSKREKFNRLQIQRLVEEGNTVTYNKRYDKLRGSKDRRISFPLASLDGVISEMGADAPEEIKNPNRASGGKGNGEMAKAASVSIEPSYIHSPNAKLDERKERYLEKVAAVQKKQEEKAQLAEERERNSTIFKIANSLVMTERIYKTANEVFNTMLSDISLSDETIDGITKKAEEISQQLVSTRRSSPGFMVTLSVSPTEKVASHLLGDYSLLKVAEQTDTVKEIKVQPTGDVTDFNQLINLARKLEQQQKQPAPAGD